jgi:hypothetical protein
VDKHRTSGTSGSNSAFNGLESQLGAAADTLRNNKHVVLGLIFPKYISDAFEAKHTELLGLVSASMLCPATFRGQFLAPDQLAGAGNAQGKVWYARASLLLPRES